jgi:hypothetical protein
MISMLVVRLTFKIKVLKMEHVFQMGYKEGDPSLGLTTKARVYKVAGQEGGRELHNILPGL